MGPFPTDIALVLTQGSLDCYSVERIEEESSNDRGDFVLHPSPCHLLPGSEMVVEWSIIAFHHDHFQEALLAMENGLWAEFAQETVFPNETFEITITSNHLNDNISVFCKGQKIPYLCKENQLIVSYSPKELGEHRFDFQIGKKRFGF